MSPHVLESASMPRIDEARTRTAPFLLTLSFACLASGTVTSDAHAQFRDDFERAAIRTNTRGHSGWAFFTGAGNATMTFEQVGAGHASIRVDATRDRRGIWWALIKHAVSDQMDLGLLKQPAYELRIEARIRVSHAPRRVNLHVNTQRTTDFHSHLMEFDIPDTTGWHTISMTTHDFAAVPGDTVYGQLALMDWGPQKYGVDIDYIKVDIVDVARAGPDQGEQVPYHPPVPDVRLFRDSVRVAHDAMIDLANPDVNLNNWYVRDGGTTKRLLAVNGTQYTLLRFDLSAFAGRTVEGHGLLELTTHSVQRTADEILDFGLVRVVEILDGDPAWEQTTVTTGSFLRSQPLERVLNPQMIIDWPVTEGDGARTYFTISRPVLQRLIDGRTRGLAIQPLGSIAAAFYAVEHDGGRLGARLYLNVGR
jgi:hypothetical protein